MLLNFRSAHFHGLACSAVSLILTGSLCAAPPTGAGRTSAPTEDQATVQEESGWRKFWKFGSGAKKPAASKKATVEGNSSRRDPRRSVGASARGTDSTTPHRHPITSRPVPQQSATVGQRPSSSAEPVNGRFVRQAEAQSPRNTEGVARPSSSQAQYVRTPTYEEPRRLAARGANGESRLIGEPSQPAEGQPSRSRRSRSNETPPTRSRVTTAEGEEGDGASNGNILALSAESAPREYVDPFAERSRGNGPSLNGPRHRMADLQAEEFDVNNGPPSHNPYRVPANRLEPTVNTAAAPYEELVPELAPRPRRQETVYTTQDYYREEPGHEYQVLPEGLMYQSYLAGEKETRLGSQWLYDAKNKENIWESTLGGRIGLLRKGTTTNMRPEGWQIDLEGAVMTRLNNDYAQDIDGMDFRFGWLWTHRNGPTAWKAGYYHLSSHAGDEYMERHPGFVRRNYVRENIVVGVSQDLTDDVRVYAEAAYAFHVSDGAKPLEFQFGAEYSPYHARGTEGAPFAAANLHLREECNFGGSINLQAGWQWRGEENDRRFRVGLQYYKGHGMQYEFFDRREELVGFGIWYDY